MRKRRWVEESGFIKDTVEVVSSSVAKLDVIHLGEVVWYRTLLESQLGLVLRIEKKPLKDEVSNCTGEVGNSWLLH